MKHRFFTRTPLARARFTLWLAFAVCLAMLPLTGGPIAQAATFPSAGDTGLSNPSLLTVHNGDMTVTQDGAVVQNLEIRGTLRIEAENVVVRNVWVYTSAFWTIFVTGGSATVEDSEIGNANVPGMRGIGGSNVTARRLDIHAVEDGIKLGNNSLYEWIYIHDLDSPRGGPHTDAIQNDGGASNAVVRGAYLDARGPEGLGNAALFIKSDLGRIDNILVENAYLNGGNYTFYSMSGGNGAPTNVTLRNSVFGPDYRYGRTYLEGNVTMTGITNSSGSPIGGTGSTTTTVTTSPPSGQFVDDENSPYEGDIDAIYAAGITAGCDATGKYFCPTGGVTRAQMAAFLVRALNQQPTSGGSPFADVPSSSWYAGYTTSLYNAGLATGCSSDPLRYCPSNALSRAEMAVLLIRALGEEPSSASSPFADVPAGSWYGGHVTRLFELGITAGCNTNPRRFCPVNGLTRGEMARFLVRAFDL